MKNKGSLITTVIFCVMALADVISTFLVGHTLLKYLETNPLFKLLGLPGIFVLNVGVAVVFYYAYILTTSVNVRYSLLLCALIVSFLRIFIVWNNLAVARNPPTIEEAQAITESARNTYYAYKVVLPILMAYVPGILAFWLFKKDHKIEGAC